MRKWKTAWSVMPADYSALELEVKDFVITTRVPAAFSGEGLRLCLANRYGTAPLKIDALKIRMKEKDFSVTMQGKQKFVLPAGCVTHSDVLHISLDAGMLVEIKVSMPGIQQISDIGCSMYPIPASSDYTGDITVCSSNPRYSAFAAPLSAPGFQLLTPVVGMEILAEESAKTLAVFGDSLVHMNMWTGPLAKELMKTGKWGVCNCGISGNRLLRGTVSALGGELFGRAGISRFEKDVLQDCGADVVIVSIGANDIIHPVQFNVLEEVISPQDLKNGLIQCAETAHKYGVKVLVGNIVPCGGADFWNEEIEKTRREINQWIKEQQVFDGLLDFASVLADPENPVRYREDYHVGDFLHMNPAGGGAVAKMVLAQDIFLTAR